MSGSAAGELNGKPGCRQSIYYEARAVASTQRVHSSQTSGLSTTCSNRSYKECHGGIELLTCDFRFKAADSNHRNLLVALPHGDRYVFPTVDPSSPDSQSTDVEMLGILVSSRRPNCYRNLGHSGTGLRSPQKGREQSSGDHAM